MSEMDWSDYESGPFCPHWSGAGDGCGEMCVCGHRCDEHLSCEYENCKFCPCDGFETP